MGFNFQPGGTIYMNWKKKDFELGGGMCIYSQIKKKVKMNLCVDGFWDFEVDNFRISPGIEIGYKFIGLELSYLEKLQKGKNDRGIRSGLFFEPFFPIHFYLRYGHYFSSEVENKFITFGLRLQQRFPVY